LGRAHSLRGGTLGAYGRASYSRLAFDAFEEDVDASLNGNGLALRVESRTVSGLSSTLGGKASFAYSASWGVLSIGLWEVPMPSVTSAMPLPYRRGLGVAASITSLFVEPGPGQRRRSITVSPS